MAQSIIPNLRIRGARGVWIGFSALIFLTAFWLSSAKFWAYIDHIRSHETSKSRHMDFRQLGIADACIHFQWGSVDGSTKNVSNDGWTYGFETGYGELRLFPRTWTRTHEVDIQLRVETRFNSIILPLWLLPLAWTGFWGWRMTQFARRDRVVTR